VEEWQVAIIEMRADLRAALAEHSRFKERLIIALLMALFGLAGIQQVV